MATTLAQIMLEVAEEATIVERGIAQSGSQTKLLDHERVESGGHWDNGVIFFTSGTNNGLTRRVKRWKDDGKEFEFASVTASVSDGDTYAVSYRDFSKQQYMQAINLAYTKIKKPTLATAITNTGAQYYSLPSGVIGADITGVRIDADDDGDDLVPHNNWFLRGNELWFHLGFEPDSYEGDIYIIHGVRMSRLTADTSEIDDYVTDEYLKWATLVQLWEAEDRKYDGENQKVLRELGKAQARLASLELPDMNAPREITASRWP